MDLLASKSNFAALAKEDAQLSRLGMLAERYFAQDPNTCLLKLRQFSEVLAQSLAARAGLYTSPEESLYDLLGRLEQRDLLPREAAQLFSAIRRAGNEANHALSGDHRTALATLKLAWQLGLWYYRTFTDPAYKSGPFQPPPAPEEVKAESEELRQELEQLRQERLEYQALHHNATETLQQTQERLRTVEEERALWEQLAQEAEAAGAEVAKQLAAYQAVALAKPQESLTQVSSAAYTAAKGIQLDEKATRKLIDTQLRQAGWEVDSALLRHSEGARPEKGKNRAIAEWPTKSGPADYVLFCGLTPVAVVEAKRQTVDVAAHLQQAKRYSRDFGAETPLPFVFSTNGRPFLRQLSTKSGIWFCDVRKPTNLARALDGWYSPEGLLALLKQDAESAAKTLEETPFHYGFALRHYQQAAIRAAEAAIAAGQREILLAMATGTGKTKTCIALIYRLLKAQRFRRVLFLVDRSALGEQATNAFKDTRMESLQTFADIFGVKEQADTAPDTETAVHVATVQGMVKRLFSADTGGPALTVDAYDCIIVDECHRGYLLDRELSDAELSFRDQNDYLSKYRRVLDYFDAVKIGLTATPALHTSEIFGAPVYTYTYREAVVDGYLVDHEPPFQIRTELSEAGIGWKVGEKVAVYNPSGGSVVTYETPDEIQIEIEGFNRKVITESFNRVVCDYLATELDPASTEKTLVFCVNDTHADLVVQLLKAAFAAQYGSCDDDAVVKITGSVDKPLQMIRRYKNERLPSVAVTVDLLTTGIDVPEICNLVFLRRVNSRILFDQMLGRATRLCEPIGKETFRIFDAVRLYEALEKMTAMQPVVTNPSQTFDQLLRDLTGPWSASELQQVREQVVAKLHRKKRYFQGETAATLDALTGLAPADLISFVRTAPLADLSTWLQARPTLGAFLDTLGKGTGGSVLVSEHADQLLGVTHGYGTAEKPEDYLAAFAAFLKDQQDTLPALVTVLTRPRDLTRKQLRALAFALDQAGYTETTLQSAWRDLTNQELAAGIVGYIRKAAAVDDAMLPYEERVDRALRTVLATREWTGPQRQWLQRIAAQTKVNKLVDREALDDPDLIFRREGGGFARLDKVFGGTLQSVLDTFNESLWK